MIRPALVYALIAAFASAPAPSLACTNISLKAKDGAAVRARTMEFGYPTNSNVVLIPAGTAMRGTLPGGGQGIAYTTKYSMLGANADGLNIIIDGMNDRGLSVGLLYFPGFAE